MATRARLRAKCSEGEDRRDPGDWGHQSCSGWSDGHGIALGEKGQLTGGYMLITLWFFKQFVHTFPRGDMLITF